MADRDRVPNGIQRGYKSSYKRICEQQDEEGIAQSLVKRVNQDIKRFGNSPTCLINQIHFKFDDIVRFSVLREGINYTAIHNEIEAIKEGLPEKNEGVIWAALAAHGVFYKLEDGIAINDLGFELKKQLRLVAVKAFEESIPFWGPHHKKVTYSTIANHLKKTFPYIEAEIERVLQHPKQKRGPIDIYDGDLMKGIVK